MSSNASDPRNPQGGPPRRAQAALLLPRVLLSRTFLLPFVAVSLICFVLAERAPRRFESRLLLGIPRPQTDKTDEGLATILSLRELESLRIFFKSPDRMQSALSSLTGDPAAGPSLAATRLARQTDVRIAEESPSRILVEVSVWDTEPGEMPGVLRALGQDLENRYSRVTAMLPGRTEQVQARRARAAQAVREARDRLEEFVARVLGPEAGDSRITADEILSGEGWVQEILKARRKRHATPGRQDSSSGVDREALTARSEFRTLRQQLELEMGVLEEIARQEAAIRARMDMLTDRTNPLEVIAWPGSTAMPASANLLFLALVSSSLGGVAGSLALFLRLAGSEIRNRRRRPNR